MMQDALSHGALKNQKKDESAHKKEKKMSENIYIRALSISPSTEIARIQAFSYNISREMAPIYTIPPDEGTRCVFDYCHWDHPDSPGKTGIAGKIIFSSIRDPKALLGEFNICVSKGFALMGILGVELLQEGYTPEEVEANIIYGFIAEKIRPWTTDTITTTEEIRK
jgi:hypothetical protein